MNQEHTSPLIPVSFISESLALGCLISADASTVAVGFRSSREGISVLPTALLMEKVSSWVEPLFEFARAGGW